jgi:hypothetical protein
VFGPDAYGYLGCASSPAANPCDDISSTGTLTALDSDEGEERVALGFNFDFYGTKYGEVVIGANAVVGFVEDVGYWNACLPYDDGSGSHPPFIAAFWDDLNPGATTATSEVRYQTFGEAPTRRFVAQWDVPRWGGSDPLRVQVQLFEGVDTVRVCYPDADVGDATYDFGASATAGIQGGAAGSAVQFSCDMPSLTSGSVLDYYHP